MQVVETYAAGPGLEVRRAPLDPVSGSTAPLGQLSPDIGVVLVQQPNCLGVVEDLGALSQAAHAAGALLVVSVDLGTLGLLEAPGALGADIVVGDAQVFGNAPSFGGPSVGFLACSSAHLRQLPGRVVGQTTDVDGRICYVLTLQAREQHIRRAKATSNICSNQALSALAATVHLALLGPQGLRERGELCLQRAHHLQRELCALPGVAPAITGPFFAEFALALPCHAEDFREAMRVRGIDPGVPLDRLDLGCSPVLADLAAEVLLVAVTEVNSPDALADYVAPRTKCPPSRRSFRMPAIRKGPLMNRNRLEPLIFDKSAPGHRGTDLPPAGVPVIDVGTLLPGVALRKSAPRLPELSELQVVRHYTRLSHLNQSVDTGFYPLGSCTMKHNPKLNEEVCALAGFAALHPYQPQDEVQGILQVMHETEQALLEITGLHRASLQPAAGAHGELTGILMIKAYHAERGDHRRDTVIAPDSAHGTNVASAAMAGYKVVEIPSSSRGLIDLDALRENLSERTAALMLTNPNTLGLFEEDVLEITRMVHEVGGLCYYDGANLNAIMGKARPGDMGMDVVHVNLHKTFSTPHGGGGPGAGPVAVSEALEPYLPLPLIGLSASDGEYYLDYDRPRSIGRVKGFFGNVGVIVRAYAYLLRMGGDGLARASEDAVLNANYLRVRLREVLPAAFDRICMHEFVLSAKSRTESEGTAMNIAKRILDFGMHAPTVYFPLIVPEALMIEPTETEDLQTLDAFVEVMQTIDRELREHPDTVREAPHTTPVRRPDETQAARHPVLRWSPRPQV